MRRSALIVLALSSIILVGCEWDTTPTSTTGVNKADAIVTPGADGLTVEQRNVKRRIEQENDPAAIKHIYVVSCNSGDCLLYSTAKGKVTSSGKRLSPYSVAASDAQSYGGIAIDIAGTTYHTGEVIQDDGTYGHSIEYLFWFDTNGNYRQLYVPDNAMVIISSTPLRFPKIVLNIASDDGK